MLKVFSGAVQFALGMLLFRGLILLFKRVLPLVSTGIGFAWGLGYEPFTWLTTAYAYVVAYTQYAFAWVAISMLGRSITPLLAHHNLHELLPFSPMYLYGAITLVALVGRSMGKSEPKVRPVEQERYQTVEQTQGTLGFADYYNLGENDKSNMYDAYLNGWIHQRNPHLAAK